MRKIYSLIALGLTVACSTPKYTASFQNYNRTVSQENVVVAQPVLEKMEPINPQELVASTSNRVVAKEEVKKTYLQMSKSERKELRKELKAKVKAIVKERKASNVESVQATKSIDNDLKLAAIFGAVGLVALIIGGNVFWVIGGIAMIIGVVFFVKWLIRQ